MIASRPSRARTKLCTTTLAAFLVASTVVLVAARTEAQITPPNDAFSAASTLNVPSPTTGQTATVTGNSAGATMEAGELRPYHPDRDCDGDGVDSSVWYKINPVSDGTLTLTTEGSSFDTVLALYRGTSLGSLTQSNCSNANNAPNGTERMSTAVKTGRTYYVQLLGTGATRSGDYKLGASLKFFGPGNWPSSIWRPFSDSSPFNKRLPSSPKLAPNSAQIVSRIVNTPSNGGIAPTDRPAHLVVHTDGSSGEPTYYSRSTDPLFTLHCTYNVRWGVCPLEGKQVRIPAGARVEGDKAAQNTSSSGEYWTQPDAHLTVVDQTNAKVYELWQVHTNPIPAQGGNLYFSWGGISDFNANGLASDELKKDASGNPVPGAVVGDATAARTSSLAGRVRAEEFAAGKINHAIAIGFNCDNGSYVYPARKSGRPCSKLGLSNADAPPLGTRIQLNMSASQIDALPVPRWKKALLHALHEYGGIAVDTGSPGIFVIETESGNQYTSMGYASKWNSFAASNGWPLMQPDGGYPYERYHGEMGRYADGIDWKTTVWSKLRVIDPCVSKGTC